MSHSPLNKLAASVTILSALTIVLSTTILFDLSFLAVLFQIASDLLNRISLDHLLWGLLAVSVIVFVFSMIELKSEQYYLFEIYFRWRQIFPYSVGSWLWHRSVLTIVAGAVLAGIILWGATRNPLVSITGFYASILFFEQALDVKIPILKLHKVERTNSNAVEMPGSPDQVTDCEARAVLLTNIENIGSATAKSYTVEYKVFDDCNEIIQGWKEADVPSDTNEDIQPREFAKGIPLDLSSENIQGTFRLVVRLSPEFFYGRFATYQAIETEY